MSSNLWERGWFVTINTKNSFLPNILLKENNKIYSLGVGMEEDYLSEQLDTLKRCTWFHILLIWAFGQLKH